MDRVTIKHVRDACDAYNRRRGLYTSMQIGWLFFADVIGDGIKRKPRVYMVTNALGGISYARELNGKTYRETKRLIEERN